MGQILHGSARTTEAIRRAIQHSQLMKGIWVVTGTKNLVSSVRATNAQARRIRHRPRGKRFSLLTA